MADITEKIEELEELKEEKTEKKSKRGRPKKTETEIKMKPQTELKEDLANVTNLFIDFTAHNHDKFSADDFKSEVRAINDLANKFPIVANVILFINPFLGLVAYFQKIISVLHSPSTKQQKTKNKIVKIDKGINDNTDNNQNTDMPNEDLTTDQNILDTYKANGL